MPIQETQPLRHEAQAPDSGLNLEFNSGYKYYLEEKGIAVDFPWLVDPKLFAQELLKKQFKNIPLELTDELLEQLAASISKKLHSFMINGFSMPVVVVDDPSQVGSQAFRNQVEVAAIRNRVSKTNGVLQISGGAAGLEVPQLSVNELVKKLAKHDPDSPVKDVYDVSKLLYELAKEFSLAIVDGGTQSGIMAGISTAHMFKSIQLELGAEILCECLASFGFSVAAEVVSKWELPPIIHIVPGTTVAIPNYKDAVYEWGQYAVAPGTACIAIRGTQFGGEAPAIESSADQLGGYIPLMGKITADLETTIGKKSRRIVVVVNGGALTLDEITGALKSTSSEAGILILAGTGRSADWLTLLLNDRSLTVDDLISLASGAKDDIHKASYREKLASTATLLRDHMDRGKQLGQLCVACVNVQDAEARALINGKVKAFLN